MEFFFSETIKAYTDTKNELSNERNEPMILTAKQTLIKNMNMKQDSLILLFIFNCYTNPH